MSKLLLVHGPPRSGKDTLIGRLAHVLRGHQAQAREAERYRAGGKRTNLSMVHIPVGRPLKEATHAFYQALAGRRLDLTPPWDHFEGEKEVEHPFFLGKSPRQAYIDVHERYIKPQHGDTTLAQATVRMLQAMGRGAGILVASGLTSERDIAVFAEEMQNPTVVLIEREGCEWEESRHPLSEGVREALGDQLLEFSNDEGIANMDAWVNGYLIPALIG